MNYIAVIMILLSSTLTFSQEAPDISCDPKAYCEYLFIDSTKLEYESYRKLYIDMKKYGQEYVDQYKNNPYFKSDFHLKLLDACEDAFLWGSEHTKSYKMSKKLKNKFASQILKKHLDGMIRAPGPKGTYFSDLSISTARDSIKRATFYGIYSCGNDK